MKLHAFLIASSLFLNGLAWAGSSDGTHKPMHGGVLTTVKDIDYELVASPTTLRLYVRDHGRVVDLSKASARLTLLTGTEKQEVDLKPNRDRLEATGAFKLSGGTIVAAVISSGGKQSTARFVLK
ncbi:hypothetical protein DU000_11140 [Parvibium lacunae]|uniref:Uncharacterized protein n=1 Tax=Parvibium lacunae TaxID=1888893 RepID=A0A368L031_9BURK|nr:hypothetical protein [Parvibium lacunae]RCS56883.1 hypothetical protein DU000_11140 [Parvibium lacunae]